MPEPVGKSTICVTRESVADAMQRAWDEFCADTNCIPDCFHIHGPHTARVTADFLQGNFAQFVRDWLYYTAEGGE